MDDSVYLVKNIRAGNSEENSVFLESMLSYVRKLFNRAISIIFAIVDQFPFHFAKNRQTYRVYMEMGVITGFERFLFNITKVQHHGYPGHEDQDYLEKVQASMYKNRLEEIWANLRGCGYISEHVWNWHKNVNFNEKIDEPDKPPNLVDADDFNRCPGTDCAWEFGRGYTPWLRQNYMRMFDNIKPNVKDGLSVKVKNCSRLKDDAQPTQSRLTEISEADSSQEDQIAEPGQKMITFTHRIPNDPPTSEPKRSKRKPGKGKRVIKTKGSSKEDFIRGIVKEFEKTPDGLEKEIKKAIKMTRVDKKYGKKTNE